jgi:hypothetical protein
MSENLGSLLDSALFPATGARTKDCVNRYIDMGVAHWFAEGLAFSCLRLQFVTVLLQPTKELGTG